MGIQTEYGIILGYVVFMGFIGLASTGLGSLIQGAPTPPTTVPGSGLWAGLVSDITYAGYFFSMIGITAVGFPILGVIIAGYTAVVLFIMLGLIRGGH